MAKMNIHCDGACLNNGGSNASAGWGLVIEENGKIIHKAYGKLEDDLHTNNRAELTAMKVSLQSIIDIGDIKKEYVVYSDSTTVVNGINGLARRNANKDIWSDISNLCLELRANRYNVKVKHCNKKELDNDDPVCKMNKIADSLAFQAVYALL